WRRRRRGGVIRLKCEASMPESLRHFIADRLGLKLTDPVNVEGILGLADTKQLILDERPDLHFTPYNTRVPDTTPPTQSPRHSRVPRGASALTEAIASPPSAPKPSSSITHSNPSTSSSNS